MILSSPPSPPFSPTKELFPEEKGGERGEEGKEGKGELIYYQEEGGENGMFMKLNHKMNGKGHLEWKGWGVGEEEEGWERGEEEEGWGEGWQGSGE